MKVNASHLLSFIYSFTCISKCLRFNSLSFFIQTLNGHAEIIETTKPNQTDTTYSQMLNGLERKTIRTTMINANHVWSQSVSHATARVTSATATSSLSY